MSDKSFLGVSGVPSQQSFFLPQFDACGAGRAQSGFPPTRFSSVTPDRSGCGGFAGEETFDDAFSLDEGGRNHCFWNFDMEWGCTAARAVVLFFFSWTVAFVPLLVQIRDGPRVDCEGGCAFHHLVCVPFLHPTQRVPFSHVMPNDVKFDGRAAFQDAVSADFFLELDGLLVLVTDDMSSSPYWNVSEFQASCGSVDPGNSQRGKEDTKSKATSQSLLISSIPLVWIESFGDKSLFSVFYWLLAGVVASAMKTMQMMPCVLQAAAAFAWLFPFTGLGAKTLDLIGLVVKIVKAAAAFFGHITQVGLYNAVFGGREFLTQVGIEATQQLGSCIIVVPSAAAQALVIAAAALESVLLTLEGNRCIGDGAARCVSLTLRARGLLRCGHVLGLRMLLDEASRLGADKVLVQMRGYFGVLSGSECS